MWTKKTAINTFTKLIGLIDAIVKNGFDVIAELTHLEAKIQSADWVISGEGKLDRQSLQGKVIDGIARLCNKHQRSLALIVGKNELSSEDLQSIRVKQLDSIADHAKNLEDAMLNGRQYLEAIAERLDLF